MSHLSRRYTNFFYVVDENGKMKQVTCMSSRAFRETTKGTPCLGLTDG